MQVVDALSPQAGVIDIPTRHTGQDRK